MQHFELKLHLNTWKNANEAELVKGCLSGNPRAQKALYDRLSPKMFSICLRYMGNREAAADVLQDGFVTLYSKLGSYLGEGSFEGWARRIFVNTALMSLRKSDVLRDSDDINEVCDICDAGVNVVQNIGYKELTEMIGELPSGFRTVFNLYVVEGYSHKEIGEMLGISENTSRSQLQRARVMLQNKITGNER